MYDEYKEQNNLTESDRVLTDLEEQVIRLCHHDFGGLTQKEAATKLGIDARCVSHALHRVKKKAPQLFPILTKNEIEVRDFCDLGVPTVGIALVMRISERRVTQIIKQLGDKGMHIPKNKTEIAYKPSMDGDIREKF